VYRRYGATRVAYVAAALDAALWNYAYPYQRRLLARLMDGTARSIRPVLVTAPMCVQTGYYLQKDREGMRIIVHLFNGMNTTANHGLPSADVPLREEVVPVHGITMRFHRSSCRSFHCEPGGRAVKVQKMDRLTIVEVPPLETHAMVVAEL
jgi:hypothetical protein